MSENIHYFTSESVAAGHPDKICDAISDAILDAALAQDPDSHAGIETVVGANQISLFGEIKTTAKINYENIARTKIKELGYTNAKWGFSDKSPVSNFIHEQSPEIAIGVDNEGAGDQGMMFGFACDETPELLPLPIVLAHELVKEIDIARVSKRLPWLRPDGKSQVTVKYINGRPVGVDNVVVAVAHAENVSADKVRTDTIEQIITPILQKYGFSVPAYANVIVNGTGVWHIPGPASDAGLTGRKIVVDGYGGYARVGGGAFSGKDASKVDRSGAYAARYLAKNIVAAGLAAKCEVGLAYVIGRPKPLMQTVETFGTEKASKAAIDDYAKRLLDTSVSGIISGLGLNRPIYSQTSAYGHFGKENLPWEKIKITRGQKSPAVKNPQDA